ncbi:MAG: hypothetical protein GY707_16350 [Desulfobacteraceae bacterium]|nr:hypothetical protein [Desulfobacteraceae bacterium]
MLFSNYFSKQARHPSGIFGRFYMSRIFKKGNDVTQLLSTDDLLKNVDIISKEGQKKIHICRKLKKEK